jgi:hypothetical protein
MKMHHNKLGLEFYFVERAYFPLHISSKNEYIL